MTDRAHRPDGSETERVHQAVAVAFPRQLARNCARELFVVLCGMALANNNLFIKIMFSINCSQPHTCA